MEAEVGDWLVVKGPIVDRCERRGLITEVRSADGTPPFVVRWLDTGHEAMVFPGPDALVVTAAEQRAPVAGCGRSPDRILFSAVPSPGK